MLILASLLLAQAASLPRESGDTPPPDPVDFDRVIRPLLTEHCLACHGADAGARKADLRLDTREGLLAASVVPGDPESSELWARVTSEFEFDRMPPPDSKVAPLTAVELDAVRRWIDEGANWAEHWAFVPPARAGADVFGGAHPIDHFIGRRLDAEGLAPSPRADARTLIRRLALDLTGLPPDPRLMERWLADPTEAAWSSVVDELFASPHHAERMAMWWLDAARYADTEGFQADQEVTNWPWRDWVVGAFAANMPFDEFTLRQFAGDLLPNATPEDVLATCFHRNHMHNGEGGRDPEESRVDYVRDRTNSIGTVWLGLTLECAQCHDHKFDPITQADYYSLSAFFNSIDESGRAGRGATPFTKYTAPAAAAFVEAARAEVREAETELSRLRESAAPGFESWLAELSVQAAAGAPAWVPLVPEALTTTAGSPLRLVAAGGPPTLVCDAPGGEQDDFILALRPTRLGRITGIELEVLPGETEASAPLSFADDGEFILTGVSLRVCTLGSGAERPVPLASCVASVEGKGVDEQHGPARGLLDDDPRTGWTTRGATVDGSVRVVLALEEPLVLDANESLVCRLEHRSTVPNALIRRARLRATDRRGRAAAELSDMPYGELVAHLTDAPDGTELPATLRERLLDEFLEDDEPWCRAREQRARLGEQHKAIEVGAQEQQVMVLRERAEPRRTYVLERGAWDQKGDVVSAALPGALPGAAPAEPHATQPVPLSRLDLARWLTGPENPLTPRAITNQAWQMLFGAGLVRTPDDLGLQGARPVHPEALDWLAAEFVDSGWDLQHVLRSIVTSEAYRRSSAVTPESLERDPTNELLARGARFRLPSWVIRDSALAVSGLLDRRIGGVPVRPPQPEGVWEDLFMGRFQYEPTIGAGRHRRTLYAFWRRNIAPTFLFDSADRRSCAVGVRRTNTPLHALTLLNDATFVECARALGELALERADASASHTEAIQWLGGHVLGRPLDAAETPALERVYVQSLALYRQASQLALDATAPSPLDVVPRRSPHDPARLAALTAVAAVLLNLDEFMTHG